MNTGRKKIRLVLVVGMLFLFMLLVSKAVGVDSLDSNLIQIDEPHSAGEWTLTSIYVDNGGVKDWVYTESTYDWCTGLGTEGDPYLIENVTVTPSAGSAILIRNSRGVHFRIKNCTAGTTSSVAGYGGISIDNSDLGELIGNNCSEGDGTGIVFDDCDNMTIQDNLLSNNGFHGLFFDGLSSGSCDDNVVTGNTLINNTLLGIYLNFNNSHNTFDDNYFQALAYSQTGISFSNYGDYNIVSNNVFQNLTVAIDFGYHGSLNVHNFNLVYGNTINEGARAIIFETDGTGNEIYDNSITAQSSWGVYVEGESVAGINHTVIRDNTISACGTGMVVGRYTGDNLIQGNVINGSSHTGLNLYTYSANNVVKENTINFNKRGIWLQYSNETHPIINNTINYNTEYGIYGSICSDQSILDNVIRYNNLSGIHMWISENNIIAGNIISDSIQDGLSLVDSDENIISGNIITLNLNGIFINESNANTIVGNMINDNEAVGILLDSSNDTVIHDNLLGGNLVCIEEVDSDGTIEYDNLCIAVDDETLDFSSVLDALTETEGIIIGGTGLGIGAIVSALASAGRKKKKK
ncbi:MAG: NosD domain-containing protein [Promethearchaeota archaeon]